MTPTERDELLLRLLAKNEERLEAIESRLPTPSNLEDHTEHHQWIQLAIRREAQAIALRQSIIDKTLTGHSAQPAGIVAARLGPAFP